MALASAQRHLAGATHLLPFVVAAFVAWPAGAEAPPWHQAPVPKEVTDLAVDQAGEGWAITSDGASLGVRPLRLPELARLEIHGESFSSACGASARLALAGGLALVGACDEVLRWDGGAWDVRPIAGVMSIPSIVIDALDSSLALAVLRAGDLIEDFALSSDEGRNWTQISLDGRQKQAAALHGGAATLFPQAWLPPWGTSDVTGDWEPLSTPMQILDTTILPTGEMVGVGRFGDYVHGPVGVDNPLLPFDDAEHDLLRVETLGGGVVVLAEEAEPVIYELGDPADPAGRIVLPDLGLDAAHALATAPGGVVLVSGRSGDQELILWRNRAPALHPGHGEPEILEGSEEGAVVAVAIDPDEDEVLADLEDACVLADVATSRELVVERHGETSHELFLRMALPGRDPQDCPGPGENGWPVICDLLVSDGESEADLHISGSVISPAPSMGGLLPPSQEAIDGEEVQIEIEDLLGCRIVEVHAEVLHEGSVVEPAAPLAGSTFSFVPRLLPAEESRELTVVVTAVDEWGREASATAEVRVLHPPPVLEQCVRVPSEEYGLEAISSPDSGPIRSFEWSIALGGGEPEEEVTADSFLPLSPDRCDHGHDYMVTVVPVGDFGSAGEPIDCEPLRVRHDGQPPILRVLPGERTLGVGIEGGSLLLEAEADDCPGDALTLTWRLVDAPAGLSLLGEGAGGEDELTQQGTSADRFGALVGAGSEDPFALIGETAIVELIAESDLGGPSGAEHIVLEIDVSAELGESIDLSLSLEAPSVREVAPGDLVTVRGRLELETPVTLSTVDVVLEGSLEKVPGTLRLGPCEPAGGGDDEPLPRGGEMPPGELEGAGTIRLAEAESGCVGLFFLGRQGLGPPSLEVAECRYTGLGEGARPLPGCRGGLDSGADRLPSCSCAAGGSNGSAPLLFALLLIAAARVKASARTRGAPVGAPRS